MKKRLANGGETRLHGEITDAVMTFGGDIYRKIRIADVIDIGRLPTRLAGTYALQAHFDICVADKDGNPAFAIEYDGGGHDASKDHLKNAIAGAADLALFRIDERLLSRSCGGMTFLQYLVHTWFMAREFQHLQETGQVDYTEPFMMSGFLKADAKHIFDSEYDFSHAPVRRIRKLLIASGIPNPHRSRVMLGISAIYLGRRDSSFIGFSSIPFGNDFIYGRAKLDIGTPSLGSLGELPFGWSAMADFCEGMVLDNLADNGEMALQRGSHAILTFDEIVREVAVLKREGYAMLRGGGGSDRLMGLMFDDIAARAHGGASQTA